MIHLANGDSTAERIWHLDIPGEMVVWREVLCEGRTIENIDSPKFWKVRAQFHLENNFVQDEQEYYCKSRDEIEKLNALPGDEELILWFEYDLFCQINLIAALSYLWQINKIALISLICVGDHPDYTSRVTLGEISDNEFSELLSTRIPINAHDFNQALDIWQWYCSPNHAHPPEISRSTTFPYLKDAVQCHLQRFPEAASDLNIFEQFIITILADEPRTEKKSIRALLTEFNDYGYGDLQFLRLLHAMSPLISKNNGSYQLSPTPGQIDRSGQYFGGAALSEWRFSNGNLQSVQS